MWRFTEDAGSAGGRILCAPWQSAQLAVTTSPLSKSPLPWMLISYAFTMSGTSALMRTAAFSPARWQRAHRSGMLREKVGE